MMKENSLTPTPASTLSALGCLSLQDYFYYFWMSVCSYKNYSYLVQVLSSVQVFKAVVVSTTHRMTPILECLGNEHTNLYGLHIFENKCVWELI